MGMWPVSFTFRIFLMEPILHGIHLGAVANFFFYSDLLQTENQASAMVMWTTVSGARN